MSAQLNLQSKYALEKMKLKKVLQMLHAEINQSGLRLQLRGGLETLTEVEGDIRQSVSMSQLLQSRTFLSTFAVQQGSEKSTLN